MPSRVLTDASLSPMVDSLWKSLLLNVPSFKKDGGAVEVPERVHPTSTPSFPMP